MAITAVDKVKINKYLKEHAADDIYYLDLCEAIGKRGKISDVEFLEYFTENVISEFNKSSKISIKQMTKLIIVVDAFLNWVQESESEIKEETLDKIRSFSDFYDEYLDRTGLDKDLDFYNDCIETLLKKVNELYPCEVKNESMTKYINKISELEENIKKLENEISNITKLKDKLQLSYDQKTKKTEALNKEIETKEKEIVNLNNDIVSLNDKIEKLQAHIIDIQEQNMLLIPYKEKYEELLVKVSELRKVIEDGAKAKIDATNIEVKHREIEALIYEKLLLERSSLDEVLKYVEKQGFISDKKEIYSLLQNIKNMIKIDDSSFSLNPNYKIIPPTVLEDGRFSISVPKGCESYDIMLTADFHIREFNNKVLSGFDMLNDYCVNNGINLILNLGDFYHGLCGKSLDYENAVKNYKIVEQSISLIPRVDGIYHAILGGNHDWNIVRYGFDPLEFLSRAREDIINLGYIHSTVELNHSTKVLGRFDIHHPNTFNLPISMEEDATKMNNYLTDIYNRQGRDRNNSYIDIFGHTHINRFNYPESYCYIGTFKDGACHLRIYFDRDKQIKNMVFMPLSATNKLVKNNEIVYKKILRK